MEEQAIKEGESIEEVQSADETEEQPEQPKAEEDYKSKYLYLAAEFENTRRRFEKEKQDLFKFGNERLLRDLLEVVDNLERTVDMLKQDMNVSEDEAANKKVASIIEGVGMVYQQLCQTLLQHGLKPIETEGQSFDPNFHEAMAQENHEDKDNDAIVQVYQKGYLLNDRLLRASKVTVNKKEKQGES